MKTLIALPRSSFDHRPPDGHPERVERLAAIEAGLAEPGLEALESLGAFAPADRAALARVHTAAHIDRIFAVGPKAGAAPLDADTWMSPGSLNAALEAAGAGIAAVDALLDGAGEAAFIAARPPGHHAEPDRAMGFCLFNTVAIAALHALDARGLSRTAIIDIDVHHGNGSQAVAETEPRLAFASIHQGWIYPGTGAAHERGRHNNIINAPQPAGTAGPAWRAAVEETLLPHLEAHEPDMLFVSAGFDAHSADPQAGLELTEDDYAWAGARLAAWAKEHAGGKLVCVLEGGYDTAALRTSVNAFLGALLSA